MTLIHLPDRGVVKVSGDDARTYLNGLVTSDMAHVSPQKAGFAALLSPQGKVLFDFLITEADAADGGGFFLDCPRALAPNLVQRLTMYKLRAHVVVEDLSDALGVGVAEDLTGIDPLDWLLFVDPRLAALGYRLIGERAALQVIGGDTEAYHSRRIALAVPEGGKDFAYSDAFPHEVLMDQLGGVDFKKGCYVGQEVVSRMEHRGTARTRIVPVTYEGGFSAIEGIDVVAGEKVIGRTGSQSRGNGLAMLRLDRLADALATGIAVSAGGIGLTASKPPYAAFDLPGVDA